MMQYRREIDGLRAVAVMPVILFHAGFSVFSGGFVGVDVFFVISGYLITTILLAELQQGSFSIAKFYERRARRILPALFFVMLASVPFAYLWMMPSELREFSGGMATVVLALSNLYFLSQIDYFAPDAHLQPLLHTWSLAIEEQYYFLFPLILLGMRRLGLRALVLLIYALVVLSFVFAEWAWRENGARSFFSTLSRFWEIGAGSLCAFVAAHIGQRSSNFLAAAGLGLIAFAIFAYNDTTPFPSAYTLVPVMGAALIILFAAEGTWVARLLGLRGFVGIGLISYSAYLWHQPIFAFARLRSLTEPSPVLMAALAVLALLLAWATWYWVERPFRSGSRAILITRRGVFLASGTVGAMFFALGLTGHLGKGLPGRFSEYLQQMAAAEKDKAGKSCHFAEYTDLPKHPVARCLHADAENHVRVVLAGDSHEMAVSEMLGAELARLGVGYYDASYSGCVPVKGLRRFDKADTHLCAEFNEQLFAYAHSVDAETIVLTARFPLYLLGSRYDNGEGGVESGERMIVDLASRNVSALDDATRQQRVLDAYERGLRELAREFNLVLVYPVPEAGWNVPKRAFRNVYFSGDYTAITTSYAAYRQRAAEVTQLFDRLVAEFPNVHAARVDQVLCSDQTGRCVDADQGGIYYYDDDHLTNTGARRVAPVIIDAIQATLTK